MLVKKHVSIQWLSPRSLFHLLFIGFTCSLIPLALIAALLSLLGISNENVLVNGEPASGIVGALYYLIAAVLGPPLFTVATWMPLTLGLWVYSRLHPVLGSLSLVYSEAPEGEGAAPVV